MFSPWEERGSEAGLGEAGQAGMKNQLCDPNPGHLTWCSVPGSVSHCGQAELQLLWLLRACCNGHWEACVRGLPDSYVLCWEHGVFLGLQRVITHSRTVMKGWLGQELPSDSGLCWKTEPVPCAVLGKLVSDVGFGDQHQQSKIRDVVSSTCYVSSFP